MPKIVQVQEIPKTLRPFVCHGIDLDWESGRTQLYADCPFCGRENKWGVNVETGLWRCLVCNEGTAKGGGNALTFVQKLWEAGKPKGVETLAKDRKLMSARTLLDWGVVQSPITGKWLVPTFDQNGKVHNLYRYGKQKDGTWSWVLKPTDGLHAEGKAAGLFGMQFWDAKKPNVLICEGPWDAMAAWEVLRVAKEQGGGLALTGSEAASLYATTNVVAVPGCGTFNEDWLGLFAGKHVVMGYDSDHPREHEGRTFRSGWDGMRRVSGLFANAPQPPESVAFMRWGPDGFDADRKSGWDVRDHLSQRGDSPQVRVELLKEVMDKIESIPDDWVAGRSAKALHKGSVHLEPEECTGWRELVNAWRRALSWTSDLEHMFSVMLAAVLSTETKGEQIWVLCMAPPSSGKTTLCEAIAVARKWVHCKSELNKVYSGWNIGGGDKDFGIIPEIQNKTLVVMDGDALLKDPNRGKILAQYRGLFDGVGRSHFNNGSSREYDAVRFTFILCGTASMREMDASEVGARFINVSFNERIDPEHERNVNRRVIFRELRNVKTMSNGTASTRFDPDMTTAKKLTGGYVNFLRENAQQIMDAVDIEDDYVERIADLAEFVAFMRSRQPKRQDEVVEREFSARLSAQYARLTLCLAAVLGKCDVDEEVMQRVRRVAMDTARGRVVEVARVLAAGGEVGLEVNSIVTRTPENEEKLRSLLGFMRRIGAAETHRPSAMQGVRGRVVKWRLTPHVLGLWRNVFPEENLPKKG